MQFIFRPKLQWKLHWQLNWQWQLKLRSQLQSNVLRACLIGFLLNGCPDRSHAFNGDEHQCLSDKAVAIAFGMHGLCLSADSRTRPECSLVPESRSRRCAEIDKVLTGGTSPAIGTDAPPDSRTEWKTPTYGELVELVDYVIDPVVIFSGMGSLAGPPSTPRQLNPSMFQDKEGFKNEYWRASHNNDGHFQGELLAHLTSWHRSALAAGRSGNLYGALTMNAISDHYLEDFFAPGHMAATRRNFPDGFALGIHDLTNRRGAKVRLKHLDRLDAIFAFMQAHRTVFSLPDVEMQSWSNQTGSIVFRGDGDLSTSRRQYLLLLAVEALSISEVIDCWARQECATVFDDYSWSTARMDSAYRVTPPTAETYFVAYEFDFQETRQFSPVFGVSVGTEANLGSQGRARVAVGLELVPFGIPGAADYIRRTSDRDPAAPGRPVFGQGFSAAPAIGLTYVAGPGMSAFGPSLRLIAAWPLIETQASLYTRHLVYRSSNGGEGGGRWSYGVRGDVGFSLFTAYAGIGSDWAFDGNGRLRRGPMLSFGVQVSGPMSRILPRRLTALLEGAGHPAD